MIKIKFHSNQDGFTLIEVGISILILSFALLAIAEMQIIAMQGSSFANRLSQSTSLAQDRAESLMLLRYDHPLLQDEKSPELSTTYTDSDAPKGYSIQWHVNSDTPSDGNKTINIDVLWNAQVGTKSFTISLIKSDLQ